MTRADLWAPVPGSTFNDYVSSLTYLDDDGRRGFSDDTCRILGRCAPPDAARSRRCLVVVGEVQSGKTASFTGLSALARDNGYPLIILLTGTKKPLHTQTHDRLVSDLKVGAEGAMPQWHVVKTPKQGDYEEILESLQSWTDPRWPRQYRRGVIVTALKTRGSMRRVTRLLEWLTERGVSVPTLIIDDEADQAGLNLMAQQQAMSSTYEAIMALRDAAPSHTYVMYTATPQANLLIELEDRLSPDSVVVLPSGSTYVGGSQLFGPSSTFFRTIPGQELQSATAPQPGDGPPPSLVDSLAYFFVALAVAQQRSTGPRPLSMLIHPAAGMAVHDAYAVWVEAILARWEALFGDPEGVEQLRASEFGRAIHELQRTVPLEDVFDQTGDPEAELLDLVAFWLRRVEVRVVNSQQAANDIRPSDWASRPGWIVIGGNKLERGFTISNLAVTYMPRGTGINAVDTIQQRGRFFGHKRNYLDLLRGWLNPDTRDSFLANIEHEDRLRRDLSAVDRDGGSLKDWRRQFFLGSQMIPTRARVVTLDHDRFDLREGWRFRQDRLYDPVLGVLAAEAREMIDPLLSSASVFPSDTRNLPNESKHHYTQVPAQDLIELLLNWPLHEEDRVALDHLLISLSHYADQQPHLDTHLLFMDNLHTRRRRREDASARGPERNWRIQNLHAGRGNNYLGDGEMRTPDAVSLQVHHVIPTVAGDNQEWPEVYALALAWPRGFDRAVYLQRT